MHWKRYDNYSTVRNISINLKLIYNDYGYEFIGSFYKIRENHIEGHGQLEGNMAPPIWNIEDIASEQL